MFSDFLEVPPEWKASLKAWLEQDPPILGQATLGGALATVPLESLASGGMIGKSGVSIIANGILFGSPDYVSWQKWASGKIWTNASQILMGPNQNMAINWPGGSQLQFSADILYFGAAYDVALVRNSNEQIDTYQRLALRKSVTASETPLMVQNGGGLYNVLVGPNNSAGGIGRQLFIYNN
jgi:hypothetical protein